MKNKNMKTTNRNAKIDVLMPKNLGNGHDHGIIHLGIMGHRIEFFKLNLQIFELILVISRF